MTILERMQTIDTLRQFWSELIPLPVPAIPQLSLWLENFDEDVIMYAIRRTARKYSPVKDWTELDAHKYATSVMYNETQDRKEKELWTTEPKINQKN